MCLVDAVNRADSSSFLHASIRNCLGAVNILQMDSHDSENSHHHHLPSTRPHCLPAARATSAMKDNSYPYQTGLLNKRGLFSRSWPRMTPKARDPVESSTSQRLAVLLCSPGHGSTRLRLCHGVSTAGAPCREATNAIWEAE